MWTCFRRSKRSGFSGKETSSSPREETGTNWGAALSGRTRRPAARHPRQSLPRRTMTPPARNTPTNRRRIAAEVVELGQALFDAALDAAAGRASAADEPFPEDDLRDAADEFFRAVR